MSFNPLISVVIPTFNRRTFLERAIESVEKQVYKNFEIIVVDDGSTDETSSFLKLSQHKSIHLTQNSGVSYARNKGVESAQGDYICFLDSDDYWLPHKLQLQTELINKDKLRWGHGEEIWVRNGVRVNQKLKHKKGGGDQFIPSLSLCLISPSTVMIEKELFLEHGGFGEKFTVCEDYDLWLRLLIDNPVSFVDTPVIEKHAGHADQLSYKYFAMDKYRIETLATLLKSGRLSPERLEVTRLVFEQKCLVLMKGYLKHENQKAHAEVEHLLGSLSKM